MQFLIFNSDLEVCLTSPSSNIIIKECAEKHDKTSEASDCIVNFIQVSSLAFHETKTYDDSFLVFSE